MKYVLILLASSKGAYRLSDLEGERFCCPACGVNLVLDQILEDYVRGPMREVETEAIHVLPLLKDDIPYCHVRARIDGDPGFHRVRHTTQSFVPFSVTMVDDDP